MGVVFVFILIANFANPANFKTGFNYFKGGENIGGEITEIVSAPSSAPKESFLTYYQSVLLTSAIGASADSGDILEDGPYYDERDPLITGEDSILQNQNPVTVSLPEPKPVLAPRPSPYYGPSLTGYFIFPTTGYNRGRLHPYNAVDISAGDDCLYENIPVFAAASGVVTATYPTQSAARWANSGYGNYFTILHPNGVVTLYAHLKNILVAGGQYVNQGSIVAFMGGYPKTPGAGNSTGCHLHFGVRGAAQPFAR